MDIVTVLENAILHLDPAKRAEAESQLNDAANNHFVDYVELLIGVVANDKVKTEVRMLASLGLKNQLSLKDPRTLEHQANRWINLAPEQKAKIKETALKLLLTEDFRVASSAAQLVAAIADIELPRDEWPELIPMIIENTKTENPANVKRASLLTIGYICESVDPTNPAIIKQLNGILIAIVQGVQSSEPLTIVRLTALNALVNSLEFITYNFEREGERNYIMQVVCEATQADDSELQASAFGCLSRIMIIYYRYMALYMEKALYGLTVSGMQSQDDKVACMAVEFWSSVCEEELEIALQRDEYGDRAELTSYNFALVALRDVLPTLLKLLLRQNDDPEDDDWSVAMAAGACLQLFSQNTGNYVIEPTLKFVSDNIGGSNWKQREAAVMAFGSILEGPDREQISELIKGALPPILGLILDEYLQVKETVSWCLGLIADLGYESIIEMNLLPNFMEALATGLRDHGKVSTNCCWALMNLLDQVGSNGANQMETSPISPFYEGLVPLLIEILGRSDNEYLARASAYEALSNFVMHSANDTMTIVEGIATEVLQRLENTILIAEHQSRLAQHLQNVNAEDRANLDELQTNILALLTNIIRRAGPNIAPISDNLMTMFLRMLNEQGGQVVEEDVLIAILGLASSLGPNFSNYMQAFEPYLTKALVNTESPTCNVAVGLVADLSQALGEGILPYLLGFLSILGGNLNNSEVRRDLRPVLLSCFGDVAASIGVHFKPYISIIMEICKVALDITAEDSSMETLDYVLNVKESILDAYVGIIGGSAEDPAEIYQFVGQVLSFLQVVSNDLNMSLTDSVSRSAVGLLGDIAAMFPEREFQQAYSQEWMTEFIKKTRANPGFLQQTKEAARWAREQQKRQNGAF